ncbi:class I SAM-dependent methyltransferase [Kibdelosporangium aridum]|uniref:Class I SAM-dependent methyltransferase n=2 Tax=Kibdelosporangium aridum TaxID=2030 RepID=A0A428YTN3_KIBAR|nr:class I SAM-dependent methyltransferase [Kibdelosporangium aridum]
MDPAEFYDSLAEQYHKIFAGDWWRIAERQGQVISAILAQHGVEPPKSVLDCTCGIGTQALPLAQRGFRVTGTDLSEHAVRRARREADERGIDIRLHAADVRRVADVVNEQFDAVISFDNSLPHLLTDDDLTQALVSARECLRPDGIFAASIRDYDALVRDQVHGVMPRIHDGRISGQAWTWSDDYRTIEITVFVIEGERANVLSTTYRALRRQELTDALQAVGFQDIRWLDPETSGFYQPVVTAHRTTESA